MDSFFLISKVERLCLFLARTIFFQSTNRKVTVLIDYVFWIHQKDILLFEYISVFLSTLCDSTTLS
jgi:hypothetical protein